jgi:hypothetical protein
LAGYRADLCPPFSFKTVSVAGNRIGNPAHNILDFINLHLAVLKMTKFQPYRPQSLCKENGNYIHNSAYSPKCPEILPEFVRIRPNSAEYPPQSQVINSQENIYYDHAIRIESGDRAETSLRATETTDGNLPENPNTLSNIVQKHLKVNKNRKNLSKRS